MPNSIHGIITYNPTYCAKTRTLKILSADIEPVPPLEINNSKNDSKITAKSKEFEGCFKVKLTPYAKNLIA